MKRLGIVAALALGGVALAQSLPFPQPSSNTLQGPITVNGPVDMTTGPMRIDGGVSARDVRADMLNAGPAALGPPVDITGPMTVTGASSFSQPPTGLTRTGEVVRNTALTLSLAGCAVLGTASIPAATIKTGCMPTYRPLAITAGVILDCYVTSPGTATLRACTSAVGVSLGTGNYGVTLVGE